MTRKIYLIRHGQTNLNRKKCFYGKLDVSINEMGKKQAQNLQKSLQNKKIELVFTSDLSRTKETADLIFPDKKKIVLAGLNEKSFGRWEGLTANQIEAKHPVEWKKWLASPLSYTPPKAESFKQFEKRVLDSFHELLKLTDKDIAIVSHLGVIRVLYKDCYPLSDFWSINVEQDSWLELIDS